MAIAALARKLFGSANDRRIKRYQPLVAAINAKEADFEKLSDEQLRNKTVELRQELANGAKLNDLIVPAFATVREAAKRTLGMRHFDVQLIGGMVLNDHAITEMRTGEGKTLVATLAAYLNALEDKGVHIVTVNDYLARRDAEWMGKIYRFLGLEVGVIVHGLTDADRKAAYAADITYGTNNEFGFDYLRDNMKYARAQMVQRGHNFAIVDEVDSILIDEARTPLIISGPSQDRSELYMSIDKYIPILTEEDYTIDEKHRSATFTDEGIEKLEAILERDGLIKSGSLYDIDNVSIVHHLNSALRAHKIFQRDKDYIVRNDDVVIIDEFTGRMMPGRRFSEGLHQALEAKENVKIQPENQTLASITFQNYFRLYDKLSGMTGTASTEAAEFADIYKLDVVTIPTNLPVARIDDDDAIYRSVEEKFNAITDLVVECRERNQPVLVGTTSIERSEQVAEHLRKKGVKNIQILNARHHEQEAQIIAQAGVPGMVTIATNMAGRGTDIQLGGNLDMRLANETEGLEGEALERKTAQLKAEIEKARAEAIAAGGLMVIGTERHESRRIDNQLRGRSGRQGDPGHSKFFVSLQDDLMRRFFPERMEKILTSLGLKDGEAISDSLVTKAIERAQTRVEAHNYDIRKNILKYDDVMNDQRKVIFEQRLELMDDDNVSETIAEMRHDVVDTIVSKACPPKSFPEQWNVEQLEAACKTYLGITPPIKDWVDEEGMDVDVLTERLTRAADEYAAAKAARFGPDTMRQVEKSLLLQSIDGLWRDHLVTLDHLSKVIGWRGLAQRDPLNEYKQEAFELFSQLLNNLRELVTTQMSHVELQVRQPAPPQAPDPSELQETHIDPTTGRNEVEDQKSGPQGTLTPEQMAQTRRNDPCPCGSGKKFKHCHGAY
ncbi:preprotein translocase subunit SecA [Pelagibacterium xiamenense]|uniref:preprotein translocase subunit SecA n=1 Tax=Pelagibacterium xiamenense TaxID=2901140 RepID=UPI001E58FD1D|nr:preprotein translocase subunit SecA [Pelagibacterium xiamenense]MCD7061257.1 preprotein translocase subunit SecA [Pelagibacterium xiamenense]